MKKAMSTTALINKINAAFPAALAVPAEDFHGRPGDGIWFRGSEDQIGDRLLFEYDNIEQEVHPEVEAILTQAGWFAEPYDSGTLMAYPA